MSSQSKIDQNSTIQFERFESRLSGFFTAGRDSKMIAYAQSDAEAWLQENPEIEVISIDTICTRLLACVTVWYRRH
jgi:hypothetical protein